MAILGFAYQLATHVHRKTRRVHDQRFEKVEGLRLYRVLNIAPVTQIDNATLICNPLVTIIASLTSPIMAFPAKSHGRITGGFVVEDSSHFKTPISGSYWKLRRGLREFLARNITNYYLQRGIWIEGYVIIWC